MLNWTSPSERALRLAPGADDLYVHIQPGLMRRQDTGLDGTRLHGTGLHDAGQRDPGQLGDAA